jgi:TolB protein
MKRTHPMSFFRACTQALAALVLGVAMIAPAARAELVINITQGHLNPMPIAAPDFIAAPGADAQVGRDIAGVIRANLERSALFRAIDPRAFISTPDDFNALPRFPDWRIVQAQALVVGQTTALPDGRLRIEVRLWDVVNETQVIGRNYATTPENWRRIAHKISDDIYKQITGEDGYFDTRIVFVAESGPRAKRVKRLAIMDQDGANASFLPSSNALVLNPRYSPTEQKIIYNALDDRGGRIVLLDIETGRQETLGPFAGQTLAARFSPDGKAVVLSQILNGNTDIWRLDLTTRQRSRLTQHPAIDTSPSYSPDGAQITFTSDRGGGAQIYVMNADGSDQKRISFGDGRYSTPVWSPRGDLIAFTRQSGGRFQIGVMKPDGTGERILSESYQEEGPSWSPNGRVIVFNRLSQAGANSLWSVDLTGQNLRQLQTTTGQASDPAWSPLLP